MAKVSLKLGTRRSALARAQSGAVARRLETLHPGLRIELVGIDTRGDRITDVPLTQLDGKAFFTAEIDAALLDGTVDLNVHSFKDLSLERSPEIFLGAVPRRENPRDIALFAPDVRARIASGMPLRIGTSSPRRAAFVPDFLRRALPGRPLVQLADLRGNVDTRLRRLHEPRGSERALDGIVLAFAGLARLAVDESVGGRALLEGLLAGLPRMLLPLTASPGAPGQGALAVECRTSDARTRALLAAFDDAPTRSAVAAERVLLAERGGGCHQRFGATRVDVPTLGSLLYVRDDGESGPRPLDLRWTPATPLPALPAVRRPWDGSVAPAPGIEPVADATARCVAALATARALLVTHRRALPDLPPRLLDTCPHVWVPGTETWFALAERGVWVEGCAEGLGFSTLAPLLSEPVLQLPRATQWLVFTHAGAVDVWPAGQAIATYTHASVQDSGAPPADTTHYYWHSGAQYERWRERIVPGAHHACGFGRTAERLERAGVTPRSVFPSAAQWRAWVQS